MKKRANPGRSPISLLFRSRFRLWYRCFGLWPCSVMSSADVDPQHSWAEDVQDDMSVVSLDGSVPPSYAHMARPGHRPRVLSQSMEDD